MFGVLGVYNFGEGVKNWPNLPMDNSKKLLTGGGRGQKSWKFADVLNEWYTILIFFIIVQEDWDEIFKYTKKE